MSLKIENVSAKKERPRSRCYPSEALQTWVVKTLVVKKLVEMMSKKEKERRRIRCCLLRDHSVNDLVLALAYEALDLFLASLKVVSKKDFRRSRCYPSDTLKHVKNVSSEILADVDVSPSNASEALLLETVAKECRRARCYLLDALKMVMMRHDVKDVLSEKGHRRTRRYSSTALEALLEAAEVVAEEDCRHARCYSSVALEPLLLDVLEFVSEKHCRRIRHYPSVALEMQLLEAVAE